MLKDLARHLAERRRRREQFALLDALSDRQLDDIGLNRDRPRRPAVL